jgi:hypothetical protein
MHLLGVNISSSGQNSATQIKIALEVVQSKGSVRLDADGFVFLRGPWGGVWHPPAKEQIRSLGPEVIDTGVAMGLQPT